MINYFQNLDWSVLYNLLYSIVPALIALTFHEYCHGRVALALGDTTAKDMGRLSLNPIKHIDFFGLLMMAWVGFGWAKPVPVNMRRFKNPKKGMALTALAGPVSNIVLAMVLLFVYGLVWPFLHVNDGFGYFILFTLSRTAFISVCFAIFNILPIPPMDGSKVLFSILPDNAYFKLMRYERYGIVILMLIIFLGVINGPFTTAANYLFEKLLIFANWGDKVSAIF